MTRGFKSYSFNRSKRRRLFSLGIVFALASLAAIFAGSVSSSSGPPEAVSASYARLGENAGRNWYVSPAGNDHNNGSPEHPWATIQHAANQVAPGDAVHVAPGLYSSAVKTLASGSPSERIRFISDVKWGAEISSLSYTAWENRGDYVDIEGFDISGDGNLGILNLGSSVRILGNHVHDIPAKCNADGGAGIDHGNYAAHDNDTIGNLVHNIGDVNVACPRVHGIYHANMGGHIANNIAFNNQGYGIHLWHAPENVVVANNLVFHNGDGGITVGAGDAPGGVIADGMVVTNNIVVENGTWGAGWAIVESGRIGTRNLYSNNLVWRNRRGIALENGHDVATINSDPKLLRYMSDGSGDYHLTEASPAVGAGTQAGTPPIDFDGRARQQTKPDIGPYHSSSAPPVWPWSY
jgi:parallel beta-helix repeat protein